MLLRSNNTISKKCLSYTITFILVSDSIFLLFQLNRNRPHKSLQTYIKGTITLTKYLNPYHCNSTVPSIYSNGEVECSNHTNNAQRIPVLQEGMAWALWGKHRATDHARQANSKVTDVHILLHLTNALWFDLSWNYI